VIKLYWNNICARSTTPLPWTEIFVTRMLTRDLFAVAHLVNISYCLTSTMSTCHTNSLHYSDYLLVVTYWQTLTFTVCKKFVRRDVVAVSLQIDLGCLCSWQNYQNGTRFKKVIKKYKINCASASASIRQAVVTSSRMFCCWVTES